MTPRFVLSGITLKPTAAVGTYQGYLLSVSEGPLGLFTATAVGARSTVSTAAFDSMLGAITAVRAMVDADVSRIVRGASGGHEEAAPTEPATSDDIPESVSPVSAEGGRKKSRK